MDIQNKINELETRVNQLQNEIGDLKRHVNGEISRKDVQSVPPVTSSPSVEPVPIVPKQTIVKKEVDWEHLLARVWLPRIFILVLLIGVLWGFGAAVSTGLITKPIRCLLGLIATAVLFWQGERQIRKQRSALGQVLLGGSISMSIITIFAAHMLYGYLYSTAAFALNILAIAAGVFISIRHKSEIMILLSTFGGFLVPFLVKSDIPNFWVFTVYELLLSVTMLYISLQYRFRVLYYSAFFLLHLALLVGVAFGNVSHQHAGFAFLTSACLQHLALFVYFVVRKIQAPSKIATLFISFTLTCVWVRFLEPSYFGRFVIIASAAYVLWAVFAVIKNRPERFVMMAIATFSLFLWINEITHGETSALVFMMEGFLAVVLGIVLASRLQLITGSVVYLIGASNVLSGKMEDIYSLQTLSGLLLIATIYTVYVLFKKYHAEHSKRIQWLLWIDSIVTLWFITQISTCLTVNLKYDMQHLVVSFAWALYAIVIIAIGIWINQKKVRLAGILFLFITLVKVICIDLPDVSIAIRAMLFIVIGCMGIVVSRLLYKKEGKDIES
ncbi:DUF2339 domain-containing protein [Paenibacillus aestuarii]|uniref:DUF2339 domain-containing protein n=1 Tax=Paenibacillus aestuarii TaxID=516965 RepID=A0ABW0K277_9BACL|nr:DUF2339 domain-containing protein [Paenibacillus aestuarii]